jgi:hypothetical protein
MAEGILLLLLPLPKVGWAFSLMSMVVLSLIYLTQYHFTPMVDLISLLIL